MNVESIFYDEICVEMIWSETGFFFFYLMSNKGKNLIKSVLISIAQECTRQVGEEYDTTRTREAMVVELVVAEVQGPRGIVGASALD